MFDFLKRKPDADSLEIERKLDQDLLEQMLFEFKDERFYNESDFAYPMAQIDLTNGELVNIDDFYEVLIHLEEAVDLVQFTEYNPSKKVRKLFKRLRRASVSAQMTLFTLTKKKNRRVKLKGNIDTDVYRTIIEFQLSVWSILHDIFESYDIRVYPAFRRKTKVNLASFYNQFEKTG